MEEQQARPNRKGAYWYRQYIGECPLCGADKSHKERVYGPRPENDADRYVWLPEVSTYDYCDVL
jgi:hypothetical protein